MRTNHSTLMMNAFALIALLMCATAKADEAATPNRQMGAKYSPLAQITASNVANLAKAWEYHTGELNTAKDTLDAFEDEPTLIEGNLIVCTPTRRIIALDPQTGTQRWIYDAKEIANGLKKCRGISTWVDKDASPDAVCKSRIIFGTEDYRLIAIDAKAGTPCPAFGDNGQVQMKPSKPELFVGEVSASSRPAIVNGVVVVGSAVLDNQRLDSPSGRVLAFDARTGKALWQFDPIPRDPSDPAMKTWLNGSAGDLGSANVWAEMAVDDALDLVYLPTTSVSGDHYGASRPGANAYADSVVALKGATGEVAWSFQFTHHDIWDYDTPSQALLIDLPHNGEMVPALVQTTKTGMIFVFNRKTGEPLFPIEERAVPQTGAEPGEWLSPTQPFSTLPAVNRLSVTTDDAWGFTPIDKWMCKRMIESVNHGSLYTPPSTKGTIFHPAGGPNWGGGGYDPNSHVVVVPTNRVPIILTLLPKDTASVPKGLHLNARSTMYFSPTGLPYIYKEQPLLSPLGAPCLAPPWAALTAVDLVSGKIKWEVPLGTIEKLAPVPIPWELGAPGAGGPLVTAGGLVFIGYASDDKLRAIDVQTGKTVWKTALPAAGTATPITYEAGGAQYVVLAAGGHGIYATTKGDSVVAYKLKQ